MLARVLGIGQDNYPENLGKCLIINAPWVFSGGWKIITPVLDSNTRSKISIIRGPAEEELVALLGSKEEVGRMRERAGALSQEHSGGE